MRLVTDRVVPAFGMPDQAITLATFQPWSHLVFFMAKSAPAWEMKWCGNRVISQNRGALRAMVRWPGLF
jgi:hypothetical protein